MDFGPFQGYHNIINLQFTLRYSYLCFQKAGRLIITPYSTEVKDRYWTLGRSALVRTAALPKGKNMALDGRLASKVSGGGKDDQKRQPFSMFWVIPRTQNKAEANLALEYAKCTIGVGIEFAGSKDTTQEQSEIGMPYFVNKKDVHAKSCFVGMDDLALAKISKEK